MTNGVWCKYTNLGSSVPGKFTDGPALALVLGLVELHERFRVEYFVAFLWVTERFYLEALLEPYRLFHWCRTWRLGQLHVLSVFLVQKVEKFAFFPCAHQEIFIDFWVIRPELTALLIRKVGDVPGVHFDNAFDRSLLLEFLTWGMKYLREILLGLHFLVGSLPIGWVLLQLLGGLGSAPFDLVGLLGPRH